MMKEILDPTYEEQSFRIIKYKLIIVSCGCIEDCNCDKYNDKIEYERDNKGKVIREYYFVDKGIMKNII